MSRLNILRNLSNLRKGKIHLHKNDTTGFARVVIDNPQTCNSLTVSMNQQFNECIHGLETWSKGKYVIIVGQGKNFSSGGDHLSLGELNSQEIEDLVNLMQDSALHLRKLPLLSVSVVKGLCLGVAAELILFCDYVLVDQGAKVCFNHGQAGVTTVLSGGYRLAQKVGHSSALDLLLSSRKLTAEECVKLGIADGVLSSDNATEETCAWLQNRVKCPNSLVQKFKRITLAAEDVNIQQLLLEKELFLSSLKK